MSAILAFDTIRSRYERGTELAPPPRVKPLRRLAATVTRRTLITTLVDICQTALLQATEAAYERVESVHINVDRRTGRTLIALPWGRAGCHQWGLRRREGELLRAILLARQETKHAPLWMYDPDGRCWLLALGTYRTVTAALSYVEGSPITSGEVARHLAQRWRGGGQEGGPR